MEPQHGASTVLTPLCTPPALFPVFTPNAVYDSPPSFVSASMNRAKWIARQHFFRVMIVFLANFVLMLEPASEQVLGQASFFGMIVRFVRSRSARRADLLHFTQVSIMLAPTFPVQVFLFVSAMLVLGMCLGWAWGCAAMAAGLKARNQVVLASAVQRAQTRYRRLRSLLTASLALTLLTSSVASATNPDVAYRSTIFHGNFLDARSTVVFGVFLAVGTFVFGLIRATTPKLMLLAIFGTIVVDVMVRRSYVSRATVPLAEPSPLQCSYGPLFPVNQYTLATTFLSCVTRD